MGLDRPEIGIIGGTGRMGSWFARLFEGQGLKVFCAGRRTDLTPRDLAESCDVVVICVDMAHTTQVIEEIGPLVPEDRLLMDLTSIKRVPLDAMLKHSKAEVVGAHPLFGPEADPLSGLKTVICRGRGDNGLTWLRSTLEGTGIKTMTLDPEEHDRMMGIIQGVNHFVSITTALCLSRSEIGLEKLMNCSTKTFESRIERIKVLFNQPEHLFEGLLMGNEQSSVFIEDYVSAAQEVRGIIDKRDRKTFKILFESLESFFGNDKDVEVIKS